MIELQEDTFVEVQPDLPSPAPFLNQIKHFIDCIVNGTECIVKIPEIVHLMEIIDALYKSAATRKPVKF